jgi:hypothetical protein
MNLESKDTALTNASQTPVLEPDHHQEYRMASPPENQSQRGMEIIRKVFASYDER